MCDHQGYIKLIPSHQQCELHTIDTEEYNDTVITLNTEIYICLYCKEIFDIRIEIQVGENGEIERVKKSVNNHEFKLHEFFWPAWLDKKRKEYPELYKKDSD